MRTLIYVPVIHTSADLGSLAEDVAKRGIADLGKDLWEEHRKTVDGFWEGVSDYVDGIDVSGMKIYQDGMIVGGEVGQRIVEESAKTGSRNYELLSRLLSKGTVLVKTEDFKLVKEERDRILALTQANSTTRKLIAFLKYKFIKGRLLQKRDKFIARQINETLKDGETGVLFIGAFHNVTRWLYRDIQIKVVRDMYKIRKYYSLLPFYHKHKEQIEELSRYLRTYPKISHWKR